ncbi:MAG: TIGR04282 family arsenosugar biosynthesis glycosyltransferase [Balneolaceae bacterium]
MKKEDLLMVFVKNPEKGKVKTRLAKSIGDLKALLVYKKLLNYTVQVASGVPVSKQVWYSSFIDYKDSIDQIVFEKRLQEGDDLGARMKKAFARAFDEGFDRVLIIGSDCPGLTEEMILNAFNVLDNQQVVIGPSEDGGYYLLGMRKFIPDLFSDVNWSTETVYDETVETVKNMGLSYSTLPVLNDIDTEADLRDSGFADV